MPMGASVVLILNEPESKSMKRYDNLKNWSIFCAEILTPNYNKVNHPAKESRPMILSLQ